MSNFYCEPADSGEPPCAGVTAMRERIADLERRLAAAKVSRTAIVEQAYKALEAHAKMLAAERNTLMRLLMPRARSSNEQAGGRYE